MPSQEQEGDNICEPKSYRLSLVKIRLSWKMTDEIECIGEFKVIPLYNVSIWCMLLDVLLYNKMCAGVYAAAS